MVIGLPIYQTEMICRGNDWISVTTWILIYGYISNMGLNSQLKTIDMQTKTPTIELWTRWRMDSTLWKEAILTLM